MAHANQDNQYAVVWPRGKKTVELRPTAQRLGTLQGKTIGQLWDRIFRGDEIFPALEEGLAQRYPTSHGMNCGRILPTPSRFPNSV